jgi:DNA-binding transcriptional regulator YdaS (Cro superfamily)
MNPIERAVEAAGGAKALAQKFQISRQAVEKWIEHKRIPAERVLEIEAASGIPRHELRPDLYPQDSAA